MTSPEITQRREIAWKHVDSGAFDVCIVGGGVNGASLYHSLCELGLKVLIVDGGDFASGTSQGSSMMVWGGILYLRNGDVPTVVKLCAARDRMTREIPEDIVPATYQVVNSKIDTRPGWLTTIGLWVYWVLGFFRTHAPRRVREFAERAFLKRDHVRDAQGYGEARVVESSSDARFTLRWLLDHDDADHVPLNYARVNGGRFDASTQQWSLDLADTLGTGNHVARARLVVNAAGAWTDEINRLFKVNSAWKHVFSKGVHVGWKKHPTHARHVMLETEAYPGDMFALLPWGPIALYGPTESLSANIKEGLTIEPSDIQLLLHEASRHLDPAPKLEDLTTLRVGVRTLAVAKDDPGTDPQTLSRHTIVEEDHTIPWVTVFGGKLTGCTLVGRQLAGMLLKRLKTGVMPRVERMPKATTPKTIPFPGLDLPVPDPKWCVEHEAACTLEDWIRRRTNISQWVPRMGLGVGDANVPHLIEMSKAFTGGDEASARAIVEAYRLKVVREFDDVLAAVKAAKVAA